MRTYPELYIRQFAIDIPMLGVKDPNGLSSDGVSVLDTCTDEWCPRAAANLRVPRSCHSAACLDGVIYVTGGRGADAGPTCELFDIRRNTWQLVAPMAIAHSMHATAALDGHLYVVGGLRTRQVECYDPVCDRWCTAPAIPAPGAQLSGSVLLAHEHALYALGGRVLPFHRKFECHLMRYDPRAPGWQGLASMALRRFRHAGGRIGESLLAVGGFVAKDKPSPTVERYDVRTDRWELLAPMGVPRVNHTVAAVEDRLYAFGGHDGLRTRDDADVYDAQRNTWELVLPRPRILFSAVAVPV